uniref:Tubulin polyglutamylase complex subunit 1 n=1 Tax=Ficedula albicollis TaxID=59894 RepID=U3KIT5_FICAL
MAPAALQLLSASLTTLKMAAAASPNGGVLAFPSCPPIGCQRAHSRWRPQPRPMAEFSHFLPAHRLAASVQDGGTETSGSGGSALQDGGVREAASGRRPGAGGGELLRRICQRGAAPAEAAAELLRRVRCRDHEAVPFDVFRYGVLTCCVLLEFAAKADALFALLGAGDSADTRLCQAVLRALEDALGAGHGSRPGRYLEAGSRLGPDRLALAMDQALQERKLSSSMSREEFLRKATALFIAKVKPVE